MLGAIVEVALDPPQARIGGLDGARARRLELAHAGHKLLALVGREQGLGEGASPAARPRVPAMTASAMTTAASGPRRQLGEAEIVQQRAVRRRGLDGGREHQRDPALQSASAVVPSRVPSGPSRSRYASSFHVARSRRKAMSCSSRLSRVARRGGRAIGAPSASAARSRRCSSPGATAAASPRGPGSRS